MIRLCLLLSLLSFALPAAALRCGNDLISTGDRTGEVRRLCGEPQQIDDREELRTWGVEDPRTGLYTERTELVKSSEWLYDFGPRRLMRLLRFENGRLVEIDELGFGSR